MSNYTFLAQAQAPGGQGLLGLLVPLLAFFAIFYFFLIRPQQKKAKAHQEMVSAVRRGDKIMTTGGIFGTVTKVVSDEECEVEIPDGVRIRVLKQAIANVINKTAPVSEKESSTDKKESK